MAVDNTGRLSATHFSGNANIFDGGANGLAAMLRSQMQHTARAISVDIGTADLTDSSGGTSRERSPNIACAPSATKS